MINYCVKILNVTQVEFIKNGSSLLISQFEYETANEADVFEKCHN